MEPETETTPTGEVALSALLPILRRLEHQVRHIGQRVDEVVPRRPIPETVKQRHRKALGQLGGHCFNCGISVAVDEFGAITNA